MRRKGGDCYEVAGRMIMDHPEMLLCHGLVAGRGPLEGLWLGHAWCEAGDVVFDRSSGKRFEGRKEHYYETGKITTVKKYRRDEACKLMLEKKNFGPWSDDVKPEFQKNKIDRTRHSYSRCGNVEILRLGNHGSKCVCGRILISSRATNERTLSVNFTGAYHYATDVSDLAAAIRAFFLEKNDGYDIGWKPWSKERPLSKKKAG